jgi:hypothetical protein
VTDLYALPPEEFTAARDEAAKELRGADRPAADAVKALRRPTVPAWLVNLLVRHEPALVEQLLDLGAQLAQAQAGGQGAALRELGEQRRALVEAVTDRALGLAGRDVAAGARAEVAATLEAALADPASAQAVRSGRLTRALSYAGFGAADLTGAVADPLPAAPRTTPVAGSKAVDKAVDKGADKGVDKAAREAARAAERQEQVRRAEAEALAAQGALDDVVRACEQAHADHERAERAVAQAQEHLAALEQQVTEARSARTAAQSAARTAGEAAAKASARVERAQTAAERARNALDRLRRG